MKQKQIVTVLFILVLLLGAGIFSVFSQNLDSLKKLASIAKEQKKSEYLLKIANSVLSNSPQEAINYAKQALENTPNDNKILFEYYIITGDAYKNIGNYKKAVSNFKLASSISDKTASLQDKGISYYHLSDVYNITSNYEEALKNVYEAQRIFKSQVDNKEWLANVYHLLAKIYYNLINVKKSIDYNMMAIDIRRKIGDSLGIALSANNLAVTYMFNGDSKKALEYNNLSLEIMSRYNNKDGIANSLFNIGLVYARNDDNPKAMKYYSQSLVLYNEIDDNRSHSIVLANIAFSKLRTGDISGAESDILKSIDIAKQLGLIDVMAMNYDFLTQLYIQKSDFKNALISKEKFIDIKDRIFNQETRNRVTELEVKIETEQKKREVELIQKKNEAQRNFFLTVILIVLLLAILFYNGYKIKKRANIDLEKKNEEIDAANRELELLNEKLFEANSTKDKFFSIISHDLRNPLYWFRNVTNILSKRAGELDKFQMIEATKALDDSAKSSLHLVENLFQWAKAQTGKIEFKPGNIDLKLLVDGIINQLQLTAEEKGIVLEEKIPENTILFADRNMFNTVILNLVSNGLKFTQRGGRVTITSQDIDNDTIEVIVSDTGLGISQENIEKLFRIDAVHTTAGTANESGSGLGLILCKEFIEQNGGSISVVSSIGKGSTFRVNVPKGEV